MNLWIDYFTEEFQLGSHNLGLQIIGKWYSWIVKERMRVNGSFNFTVEIKFKNRKKLERNN